MLLSELRVFVSCCQEFRPVTLEELEGRRRKDVEEQLIKRDMKRQKIGEVGQRGPTRQLAAV